MPLRLSMAWYTMEMLPLYLQVMDVVGGSQVMTADACRMHDLQVHHTTSEQPSLLGCDWGTALDRPALTHKSARRSKSVTFQVLRFRTGGQWRETASVVLQA
jgi:hypothetical protein